MIYGIPEVDFPEEVEVASQLIAEERPNIAGGNYNRNTKTETRGAAFHEKKEKNLKVNQGGSYKFKGKKYKKPKTKGDKIKNRKSKRK